MLNTARRCVVSELVVGPLHDTCAHCGLCDISASFWGPLYVLYYNYNMEPLK